MMKVKIINLKPVESETVEKREQYINEKLATIKDYVIDVKIYNQYLFVFSTVIKKV